MKKKNETTNGPDMTTVQMKELKQLRAEERRLIKADGAREKALGRELTALENASSRRVKRIHVKAAKEVQAEEKAFKELSRPLYKEWHKRTAGLVKNERLAAVRHRIAILEGRNQ